MSNPPEAFCQGKVPLPTLDIAKLAAKRGNAKHQNRSPYRCAICKAWHVGGSVAPKSYRKATKT